jgi:hypothetical protein
MGKNLIHVEINPARRTIEEEEEGEKEDEDDASYSCIISV